MNFCCLARIEPRKAAAQQKQRQKRMDMRRRYARKMSSNVSLSVLLMFIFLMSPHTSHFFGVALSSRQNLQQNCSRACVVQNCNSLGIRYGKYCGVGWTGCPGEKPCDELDGCCKAHDECVDKKGLMNIKCHERFKKCIKKVQKSGKAGFSEECPYDIAVPTMTQGMDMAIMFSQFSKPDHEL